MPIIEPAAVITAAITGAIFDAIVVMIESQDKTDHSYLIFRELKLYDRQHVFVSKQTKYELGHS